MPKPAPPSRFGSLEKLLRAKATSRRVAHQTAPHQTMVLPARNDLAPSLDLVLKDPNLLIYPKSNARAIEPDHIVRVQRSVTEFGCIDPVVVDRKGNIIDGVIRVEAARLMGMKEIPCIVVEHLTPAQAKQFRITVNRLQERGSWGLAELRSVLGEMMETEFEIQITGFDREEIDLILQDEESGEVIGSLPEPDRKATPTAKLGDIVRLGPHAVICGDARSDEEVGRVLQTDARLVLTDPPYNVRIRGHVTRGKHREFAMASGEMTGSEFDAFNAAWMAIANDRLVDGGMLACFIDWGGLSSIHAAAMALKLEQINLIVWAKTNAGMGSLYRSQHELLPLFKKGREKHVNNVNLGKNGRWRSNVWEYAGASSLGSDARAGLKDHPTVKPIAMLEDAILDLTHRGEIVFDPFLGSGSTLLAAQRSGRICRGVEIDPHYVDLIAKRYQMLTGETPVIENAAARKH
jgi:DNA modification methylase